MKDLRRVTGVPHQALQSSHRRARPAAKPDGSARDEHGG
jgi:hypothetical protein